jgi:hypothetical protein
MAANANLFPSVAAFRVGVRPSGTSVFSHTDELGVEAKIPSGFVLYNGKKITIKDTGGNERTIRCNYGIMRLLHLRDSYQDVCAVCRAIPIFCDCPLPKPETTRVTIR